MSSRDLERVRSADFRGGCQVVVQFENPGRSRRAPTSELAAACVTVGVPLPESVNKQRDYVSSILSHSALINNIRGQGYGLAEWPLDEQKEEYHSATESPDSVGALSGYPKLEGELPLSVN